MVVLVITYKDKENRRKQMREGKEGRFVVCDLKAGGWGEGGRGRELNLTAFRGKKGFLLRNLECLRIWRSWVLLKV